MTEVTSLSPRVINKEGTFVVCYIYKTQKRIPADTKNRIIRGVFFHIIDRGKIKKYSQV